MKRRDRIGNPGLRADKKERDRLGIPDGIWVRHQMILNRRGKENACRDTNNITKYIFRK